METTPAALPVPLLTDEQNKVYPPLSEERRYLVGMHAIGASAAFTFSNDPNETLKKRNLEQWAEFVKPEDLLSLIAENAALKKDAAAFTTDFRGRRAEWRQEQMQSADEVARLLEEERRTGGGELRGKVAELLESFAAGCVPVKMEPGFAITPYWRGVNTERASGLAWAQVKCAELGIAWPIKPIPYKGDLPSEPTPAAPCQRDCQTCEKGGAFAPEAIPRKGEWWRGKKDSVQRVLIVDVRPVLNKLVDFKATGQPDATEKDMTHTPYHTKYMRTFLRDYEPEAAAGGAGVGLQGEPAELWATDPKKVQSYGDYCAACVESGGTRLTKKGWLKHQKLAAKRAGGLQGEEGGGRG